MGSFYATCSISGITLANQETYILILVPSQYCVNNPMERYNEIKDTYEVINKEPLPIPQNTKIEVVLDSRKEIPFLKGFWGYGALSIFTPFGFPIKGIYDDYGRIRDIEKNYNVKILEDFFNIPIEKILKYLQTNEFENVEIEKVKNFNILKECTITYIRSKVFDVIVKEVMRREFDIEYIKDKYKEIVNLEHYSVDFQYYFFVNSLCKFNFLKYLKPSEKDFDLFFEYYKILYAFVIGIGEMNRLLIPSLSGGQEINWDFLKNINKKINNIIEEDINNY